MKLGMLAIGMSILIAVSALGMVASAVPDKSIKFDEKKNLVTFVGIEEGDEIEIGLNGQNGWRHTHTLELSNTYKVQIRGDMELMPLQFADDILHAPPNHYRASALILVDGEIVDEIVFDVTITD